MKKEYLPIGSVVLLKNTKKRLMVTGFYVRPNNSDTYFDYLGCIFPEGMISEHENYIFNNDQIEEVCYKGLYDAEEANFKAKLYEIIGEKESAQDNRVISIPVDLYEEYGMQKNDIISIPLDKYNESLGIISIPADLYEQARGTEVNSSNIISIPAKLYKKYAGKVDADNVIRIPIDEYEKATGANIISIPVDEYDKARGIISIPLKAYNKAKKNQVISIPLDQYEELVRSKSVIRINARTYEQFLEDEKHIIKIPTEKYLEATQQRMISIPLNVYEKLQKKENVISVPLNVYEKMIREEGGKVISIPLDEYERLTRGTENNGIITLPASVYDEMLRREKSGIDSKNEIIEIPYDLYAKAQEENN